jgi:spermidine synthase
VKHFKLTVIPGLAAVGALMALMFVVLASGTGSLGRIIHTQNSLYNKIFVYQEGSVRSLRFGKREPLIVQSRVDLANPRRHVHEYTTLAFAALLYNPEPERALVVGLGGGVIPRDLRHYFPDLKIDVAEIDPAIPEIAKEYFLFETDEELAVHVMDGRVFVKRLLRREEVPQYELIVLDACTSEYIPFHLMTREYLEELKGILADDGALVSNAIYSNRLAEAQFRTFETSFRRCQVYVGQRSTNAMLVAPGPGVEPITPEEAAERAEKLQEEHEFAFDIRRVAGRLRPDLKPDPEAPILTDDRAPVNRLRHQDLPEGSDWSE